METSAGASGALLADAGAGAGAGGTELVALFATLFGALVVATRPGWLLLWFPTFAVAAMREYSEGLPEDLAGMATLEFAGVLDALASILDSLSGVASEIAEEPFGSGFFATELPETGLLATELLVTAPFAAALFGSPAGDVATSLAFSCELSCPDRALSDFSEDIAEDPAALVGTDW